MFCINCLNPSTNVTNSRPNKKSPQIWRRRLCPICGVVFTTYERPSLSENKKVSLTNGTNEEFNIGQLILSISRAFTHAPLEAQKNSLWIAQTAEDTLSISQEELTPRHIATTTYQVLKRYDELAAMQYAAQHQLISSLRRRGRPSFGEHEPPQSPSLSR